MRTKQMSWKLSVVSCLALLLSGLQVASAKGPSGLSSPAREPDPSMLVPDGRINLRTGVPEALYGVGYEVTADTPEAMARQYLRENAARLGLRDASLADLTHLRTQKTLIGHTVRFQQ